MITDLPNPDDFKSIAKEWLVQSFQIIFDYSEELEHLSEWEDKDWHFHRGKLSTALVLIHQAIEAQIKAEVCNVSPYFLLDIKPQDWPTLPDSKNKSFNELFTIGSEALIRVYLGICSHDRDKGKLTQLFEEVKVKRNKIVHGIYKDILAPKYLLELEFRAAREVFEDNFWNLLKAEEKKHPLYNEHFNDEYLISDLYYKLSFIENYLGEKKLKSLLNKTGRKYNCPYCTRKAQNWDFKSVFLNPNEPNSLTAICVVCDLNFEVVRQECLHEECKGNVFKSINEELLCLTCLEPIN